MDKKIFKVKGLAFPAEEKQAAWDKDRALQLGLAFPGKKQGKCNLNCIFCYTSSFSPAEGTAALSEAQIFSLLEEARKMGIRNLMIPGYGEPFMNPEFWGVMEKAQELGLYVTVFSNASFIDKSVAERLRDLPVSLMIKLNSLDRKKQDKLVGKTGFSRQQWRGLNALIDAGFNRPDENGEVRLAIHTIISKDTVSDVSEVVEWAIKRGIFPFVEELFPDGSALRHEDVLGTPEEIRDIYGPQVREAVRKMYPNREQEIFGVSSCDMETYSIFVEQFSGRGVECFSRRDKDLGNYVNDGLEGIWAKNKKTRRARIEEIDPRSPNFKKNCGDCSDCPGRKAAFKRLELK